MKSSINFGLYLIMLFIVLACNNYKKDEQESLNKIKQPEKIVSIAEAKNGYDNYTKKRVALIETAEEPYEDGKKFIASRYGDYDIETLKNYIAYVEQEAKVAGVKVETLRFYFSTYPDKKAYPNKKEIKHPRQNTFFILPTMEVNKINHGFYIKNLGDGKKEAALIKDYNFAVEKGMGTTLHTQKSLASIVPSSSNSLFEEDESLIMNLGHMGPPPYDSDFN